MAGEDFIDSLAETVSHLSIGGTTSDKTVSGQLVTECTASEPTVPQQSVPAPTIPEQSTLEETRTKETEPKQGPFRVRQATETLADSTDLWIHKVWDACKTGRSSEVKKYLETSKERDFIVRGKDLLDNTALIVAATAPYHWGESAKICQLLLQAGAEINATNYRGRTALMEASLWGNSATVMVLLDSKWTVQANKDLRDTSDRRAIDLAGTQEKDSLERYRRCLEKERLEMPWLDNQSREKIVKVLSADERIEKPRQVEKAAPVTTYQAVPLPICWIKHPENTISESGSYRTASTQTKIILQPCDKQPSVTQRDIVETQSQATIVQRYKEAQESPSERLIADLERQLIVSEGWRCLYEDAKVRASWASEQAALVLKYQQDLLAIQHEFTAAKMQIQTLQKQTSKRRVLEGQLRVDPNHFQFHETHVNDHPYGLYVGFTRNFYVGQNRFSKHPRTTIAYMEIDSVPYFAKNGEHSSLADGFISGLYWTGEARVMFRAMGSGVDSTYFMHTEPQLMALYVTRFLDGKGFLLEDFGAAKTLMTVIPNTPLEVVHMCVSRAICSICLELSNLANTVARQYGFVFLPEDVSRRW